MDNIITNEIPDIFYQCKDRFGVEWGDVIITYYPKIHTPIQLTEAKLVHELTHLKQQEEYIGGVKDWWARYLQDDEFRLSQELEAYRQEVVWIMENIRDRSKRYFLIRQIRKDLSSSIYGGLVSFEEATKLLS